jgi:polyisoprenyl-teichoic acid--peptidoglycan teichoic acid transferase
MANQPMPPYRRQPNTGPPKVQDIIEPTSFPAVGMTLSSYKHDPFSQLKNTTTASRIPKQSRFARLRSKVTLKRTAITLALVLLVAGVWVGGKFFYNFQRLFGGNVLSIFTSTKLDGEDSGRVNILLAGNSADDPGHQGANLTDSIMILSIDTKNKQAFMLSVPRDLYVAIPGHGHQKINAANVIGNSSKFSQNGYPKGGMGLLERTIEKDFGIDINYYALINYQAFKQAVDAVGGIDITIQSSDKRGLYDPDIDWSTKPPRKPLVKLTNGRHHLNGQQALNLSRARGDAYGSYGFPQGDFDRTAHQRQMLLALRQKATSAGVLTNPVRLGQLFDSVGANVTTDLKASNMHRLYDITKDIGSNKIKSFSLNDADGKNLLDNYRTSRGESALIPAAGLDDYSQIRSFLQRIMSNNPIVREGATVILLNATDVNGVAAEQEKKLEAKYINVVRINDAPTTQIATQIIDLSSGTKPTTRALLTGFYGSKVTTTNPYTAYKADFIIILGSDRLTQ